VLKNGLDDPDEFIRDPFEGGETAVERDEYLDYDLPPEDEELEALYSPDYLMDCADDEARQERLEELKRRIAHDMYEVDAERIAEGLLFAGDLVED
jgi:anti-sigma28 factor (negative regulator of flagellin synthesis)